jgi:hypothetical protein
MRSGLEKLDTAIAQASAEQTPAHRKAAPRWRGGRRWMTVVAGTVGVAAAVAVAGALVLPLSSTPSKTASRATATSKPTGDPGAEVTLSSVSYTIDTTPSGTPAAAVLDAAAAAIGKQAGAVSEPNVDWSGPYFHMVQVATCNGGTTTSNVWETRTGDGAGDDTGEDCSDPGFRGMYPIMAGFTNFYRLGDQPLTESQVDHLPTDPDKLWPLLEGLGGDSLGSDPASPNSHASILFQSIWNMITGEPLSPAFRKALLEDAAKIPGITVAGKYTDSLGRTGTVLHIGIATIAIDSATGQILSMTENAIPNVPICGGKAPAHDQCQPSGSSTVVYVSAQLVPSVPNGVADMIGYARAHEPEVPMAPAPAAKLWP